MCADFTKYNKELTRNYSEKKLSLFLQIIHKQGKLNNIICSYGMYKDTGQSQQVTSDMTSANSSSNNSNNNND